MRPVTSRSSATPSMRQGAKLPCRNALTSDSRRAMSGSLSGRGAARAPPGRGRGELGDQPVAQKRDGGILGGEVAAGEQRGDTVRGAPAGARRLLDRDAQPARGGDGGEHAAQPVVRREPSRRGPPRVALLEHEAVVRRVREAVLEVAVEGPGERLDWV